MSISISGLGSGLDYQSWITKLVAIKQADIDKVSAKVTNVTNKESALSTIKTAYTTLQSSINSFYSLTQKDDPFNQKAVKSSSDAVTASVSAYAAVQNVKVSVTQLATATTAQSSSVVAKAVSGNTLLSKAAEGAIEDGNFSIYVTSNGTTTKQSISVASTDKLSDVMGRINGISGLTASVTDGKLTIAGSSGQTISIGSSSDSSNFANVFSLSKNEDGSYTSSKPVFETDSTVALTSTTFAGGSVTAGKFKIGNAEFTIDSATTLDGLIGKINSNKDAGVNAYWDSNSGKLVLESTNEGAVNINVESGTSNFTDIMGLTSGGSIISASQSLGQNAKLSINGTSITSSSNTVTSDVSGITGLTLTLNSKTVNEATGVDTAAKVAVSQDTTKVASAITKFVTAINTLISQTDTATGSNGTLHGENILSSLRNKLRMNATSGVTGQDGYTSLADIGITSGEIGTDPGAATNQLVIDNDKLTAALTQDPAAVKSLLVGFTSVDSEGKNVSNDGVLTQLKATVTNALNPVNGYFVTRKASYESQIGSLNKTIDNKTEALKKYQAQLETKFGLMDKIISSLQSQAAQMDKQLGISSSNSDKNNSSK